MSMGHEPWYAGGRKHTTFVAAVGGRLVVVTVRICVVYPGGWWYRQGNF